MVRASIAVDQEMFTLGCSNRSGSTGVFAVVTPVLVVVGNVGDSRAVMVHAADGVNGLPTQGITGCPLSIDHTPSLSRERARVIAAGGHVLRGRVDGTLAVTRAFGDFSYKTRPGRSLENQPVTSRCEVQAWSRGARDRYLILACDGIWDVATNSYAATRVHNHLCGMKGGHSGGPLTQEDLEACSSDLIQQCLERGSRDNITAMVIHLAAPNEVPGGLLESAAEEPEEDATSMEDEPPMLHP